MMALHLASVGGSLSACVGDVAESELAIGVHSMAGPPASSVFTPLVLWLTHEDSFVLDISGLGGKSDVYDQLPIYSYRKYIGLKLGCVFCVRYVVLSAVCA